MNDICELFDSGESSKLLNLKERYEKDEIYTYASKLLISINPNHDITHKYGLDQLQRYQGKNIFAEPPHIYAIANKAVMNIKDASQSIVISGITGSGKTESTKHVIDYLCHFAGGIFDRQTIIEANPILEAFGNAKTTGNKNSSRFNKLLELHYDAEAKLVGAQMCYHMLEINRLCGKNSDGYNFNIFYSIRFGAPNDLKKDLGLNDDNYEYLQNSCDHPYTEFEKIDNSLTTFGLGKEMKTRIYKVLAAILCLGNTKFEDTGEDSLRLSNGSQAVCDHVANLLSLDSTELRSNLLNRTIKVNGTSITIPLSRDGAGKSRDNFSKRLYSLLFEKIVHIINETMDFQNSNTSIAVLDIAGFECLNDAKNSFDQLCINYTNERFQQYFIQRTILEEKHWYEMEGIQLPSIPFFDNCQIVEIFDHTSRGILALLNDECLLPNSCTKRFIEKLRNVWNEHRTFVWSKQSSVRHPTYHFTIRHFYGDVAYSTNDFIEKNYDAVANSIGNLAEVALDWLGPAKIEDNSMLKISSKSISSSLKTETSALIEKLMKTDSHFIRCVKPNAGGLAKNFDQYMILSQLRSSSTLSYADFVRFGFPLRRSIEEIRNLYEPYFYICAGPRQFHVKLLLSNGFRIGDFKIGCNYIFFRSNKHDQVQQLLLVDSSILALKRYIARSRWLITSMLLIKFLKERTQTQPSQEEVLLPKSKTNAKIETEKVKKVNEIQETNANDIRAKNRAATEKRPMNEIRYDAVNHWPELDGKKTGARCKNEKCKQKSHFFCSKCEVHLCLTKDRNCFKKYHILTYSK